MAAKRCLGVTTRARNARSALGDEAYNRDIPKLCNRQKQEPSQTMLEND